MTSTQRITIIGAGPAGCLVGGLLARAGREVIIYEKRQHQHVAAGRTISLSLSPRGLAALDEAGIGNRIRTLGVTMRGRVFYEPDQVQFQPYARSQWTNLAIDRHVLSTAIWEWAEAQGVQIRTGVQCLEYLWRDRTVVCENEHDEVWQEPAPLVIGADGVASEIRNIISRAPTVDLTKRAADQVYREVHIAPGAIQKHVRAIHIWPRGQWFLVAMPAYDGGLRGTLVLPEQLDAEWMAAGNVNERITEAIPQLQGYINNLQVSGMAAAPIVTIRMNTYHLDDQAVLIGDAAHAMVPFLGQGVNIALQDAQVLAQLLIDHADDPATALAAFTAARVPEGQACADLSQANFEALLRGAPPRDDPVNGVVARVNFWRHEYAAVARTLWPDWSPDW